MQSTIGNLCGTMARWLSARRRDLLRAARLRDETRTEISGYAVVPVFRWLIADGQRQDRAWLGLCDPHSGPVVPPLLTR